MSTRSNIAIHVKETDFERVSERCGKKVSAEKPFIQIYCHHDGYPEHMLDELRDNFGSYEQALELILLGDTSGVFNGKSEAYTNYGESYEDNAPDVMETPECWEEYLYVFDNNTWKVFV